MSECYIMPIIIQIYDKVLKILGKKCPCNIGHTELCTFNIISLIVSDQTVTQCIKLIYKIILEI